MNHPDNFGEQDEFDDIEYVSKSQIKKEMHELRDIGARLQELKPAHLEKLVLTERLKAALEEGRRIKSFNAKKTAPELHWQVDARPGRRTNPGTACSGWTVRRKRAHATSTSWSAGASGS